MTSCASPKIQYADNPGNLIYEGPGGSVRSVDGIEIWTDGAPKQKFKVIGVMQQSQSRGGHGRGPLSSLLPGSSGPSQSSVDAAVVKLTKSHGGDGIIVIRREEKPKNGDDDFFSTSIDSSGGSTRHSHRLQALIIKYVH